MCFYVRRVPISSKVICGGNTVTEVLDKIETQMPGVGKFENSRWEI